MWWTEFLSDLFAASHQSLTPLSKTLLHQKRVVTAYLVYSIPKSLPEPCLLVLHSFPVGFTFNNLHFSAALLCYQAVVPGSPSDLARVGSSVRNFQVLDVERHVPWGILRDADPVSVLGQENVVARAIPPKNGARALVMYHSPHEHLLHKVLHRHIGTRQDGRCLPCTLDLIGASQVQKSCRKNGERKLEKSNHSEGSSWVTKRWRELQQVESTKSKAWAASADKEGWSAQGWANKKATWCEEDRWESGDRQGHCHLPHVPFASRALPGGYLQASEQQAEHGIGISRRFRPEGRSLSQARVAELPGHSWRLPPPPDAALGAFLESTTR